jgi:hypothetical protein
MIAPPCGLQQWGQSRYVYEQRRAHRLTVFVHTLQDGINSEEERH